MSYSYSYSYSYGTTNKKEDHTNKNKINAASTFDLDSFWQEEKYYAFSLSYSYSYSYDSNNDKGSYEITGNSVTSMPEYDDETNTESETKVLLDIETAPDNNNNDINLEQSSVNEEITVMPTVVSVKADDNEIENVLSLDTSSTSKINAANATITFLKSEAVTAVSNNMEGMRSLAQTAINAGIGLTAVVALLLLKKRQ